MTYTYDDVIALLELVQSVCLDHPRWFWDGRTEHDILAGDVCAAASERGWSGDPIYGVEPAHFLTEWLHDEHDRLMGRATPARGL